MSAINGYDGTYYSSNNGSNWYNLEATDGLAGDFLDTLYFDGTQLLVSGGSVGEAYKNKTGFSYSEDLGMNWTPYDRNTGYTAYNQFNSVAYDTLQGSFYIAVPGEQFLRTFDQTTGTFGWMTETPIGGYYNAVAYSATGNMAVTGQYFNGAGIRNDGTWYSSTDSEIGIAGVDFDGPIYATDTGSFYFIDSNLGMARTTDNGATWDSWLIGDTWTENPDLNAVVEDGGKMYVATNVGLYISASTDTTTEWYLKDSGAELPSGEVYDVEVSGDTIIVGTYYGPYLSQDGGTTFAAADAAWTNGRAAEVEWVGDDVLVTSEKGLVHYVWSN